MRAHSDLALAERPADWFLAESDHRVANSLAMIASLVRLQAAAASQSVTPLTPVAAQAQLEETAQRIDAVGRLHRALAAGSSRQELDPALYLREIAELAKAVFDPNDRVALTCTMVSCAPVEVSRLAALGLIVNEAIVNAVKYAHPAGVSGVLAVSCGPLPGGAVLVTIEDDGVGLPDTLDHRLGGGLGFRIMRSLAGQLGATLDFRSTPLGLSVEITLAR